MMLAVLLLVCRCAAAQDSRGAVVGGTLDTTLIDSRTEWSFSADMAYQLDPIVAFGIEATAIPSLHSPTPSGQFPPLTLPGIANGLFPPPEVVISRTVSDVQGRAVLFTTNTRVTIPVPGSRLAPYFVVGGGVASIQRSATVSYTVPAPLPVAIQFPTQHLTQSTTSLAVTIGGGLGIRLTEHASLVGDLRYFRLLGSQDQSIGRFGVGARYQF